MGILVFRDRLGQKDLLGRIDYSADASGVFSYDSDYLTRARAANELGISETMPLDDLPYTSEEFGAFFRGLLPEGEVYGNLARLYQVSRSDYLSMLEQIGCESIGALTFFSESVDPTEYTPRFEPVSEEELAEMARNPERAATIAASSTRLSLAGAQSKVAWHLPKGRRGSLASDWLVPFGSAPSTHIVKVSRRGEEDIARNELVCSELSRACGIETALVSQLPEVPGSICVERYDRVWEETAGGETIVRLHQEDLCQALGFAPHLKYQPSGVPVNYPTLMGNLLESASANPASDKLELLKRIVFCYAVGNTDCHLKNFSLLYNLSWKERRLAPMYDITCIPLTGYSTDMPFEFGRHRKLDDIDEDDIIAVAMSLGIKMDSLALILAEIANGIEGMTWTGNDFESDSMLQRILENAEPRVGILKHVAGML